MRRHRVHPSFTRTLKTCRGFASPGSSQTDDRPATGNNECQLYRRVHSYRPLHSEMTPAVRRLQNCESAWLDSTRTETCCRARFANSHSGWLGERNVGRGLPRRSDFGRRWRAVGVAPGSVGAVFVDLDGRLRSIAVRPSSARDVTLGMPTPLKVPPIGTGHWGSQYDVSADGRRIPFLDRRQEDPRGCWR
jgi:hypothetical protein